jgi:hypothetical protein
MMQLAGMFVELGRLRPPTPQPSIMANVAAVSLPDRDDFLELIRQRDYAVPEVDEPRLDECAAYAEDLVFFGP